MLTMWTRCANSWHHCRSNPRQEWITEMVVSLQISIDDAAPLSLLSRLSGGDIAFGTAQALNETMTGAQGVVRRDAYLKAFTARNRALPKALTAIPNAERANKRKLIVRMVNVRDGKTGRMAGEGFVERQIEGGRKTAKGSNIAIPVIGRGLRRGTGGSIPKGKKPAANSKLFRVGNKLMERTGKRTIVTRYILTPTAKPSAKRFEYLTIGERYILENLPRIWRNRIRGIIGRMSLQSRGVGIKPRSGRLP